MYRVRVISVFAMVLALTATPFAQREVAPTIAPTPPAAASAVAKDDPRVERLKADAVKDVESAWALFTQQMVDQIFSFGELGFQEVETNRLPDRHAQEERLHGRGRASPAFRRRSWRRGDRASRSSRSAPTSTASRRRRRSRASPTTTAHRGGAGPRRGAQLRTGRQHHRGDRGEEDHGAREAARHDPHLAGHRRGAGRHQGVLTSAPASSRTSTSRCSRTSATTSASRGAIGERHRARLGRVHVSGARRAHAAGAPWRGRSALDAVELMNIGWNYRREHLPLEQRSHYVDHQRRRPAERRAARPRRSGTTSAQTTYPKIKELWEHRRHDRARARR